MTLSREPNERSVNRFRMTRVSKPTDILGCYPCTSFAAHVSQRIRRFRFRADALVVIVEFEKKNVKNINFLHLYWRPDCNATLQRDHAHQSTQRQQRDRKMISNFHKSFVRNRLEEHSTCTMMLRHDTFWGPSGNNHGTFVDLDPTLLTQ
jgi:hypothetical protein